MRKHSNGIGKRNRKVSTARLEQFIEEAIKGHHAKQGKLDQQFGDIVGRVTYRGSPGGDPIPHQVEKSLPIDSVKEELEWRLREISYPFSSSRDSNPAGTINDYIQKRGIMAVVTGPVIVELVRTIWTSAEIRGLRRRLRKEKRSSYMHPLAFHQSIIREIAAHLEAIDRLTRKFQVPPAWISEYRGELLKALLKEALILQPDLQRRMRLTEAKAVDIMPQVKLFKAIDQELRNHNINSAKFASHLTAVICSPLSSILDGTLKPTPDTIRLAAGKEKSLGGEETAR